MPYQPKYKIEKLQNLLQQRLDNLFSAMQGSEVSDADHRLSSLTSPHRLIRSDDVRVAVDDFSTILKEVKATLGKR